MDKIIIKDLEIYAYHGVNQQEKDMGQRFLVCLELSIDLKEAAVSGDLNKTVNYAELTHKLEEEFKKEKLDLIETAAEKLAKFVLLNYERVERVKLMVKKPWAPIGKPIDYAAVEIDRQWHRAYIGAGSNMGEKEKNIKAAIEIINNSESSKVTKTSRLYETKPVEYTEQDDFINCAFEIKTLLTPLELINNLMNVEKDLKRERLIKWGPRTIDLDVLLYDNLITYQEEIIIPHPRMHERLFVLKPLSDIAPYVMHPVLNKRIGELEKELSFLLEDIES